MSVLHQIGHQWMGKNHTIQDPGTGNTFAQCGAAYGLASVGAGTYTLPDDGLPMYVRATGSVTIQSAAAVTVATMTTGQIAFFVPATSTTWVAHGPGAGNVSITDSNSRTTATTVEAWLDELADNQRTIEVPLMDAILAAGTPMAAWADNASPNPGITLANSKAVGLRWNNNATQNAPVWFAVPMPYEGFDTSGGFAPTINVLASKVGATVGDATTFTVTAFGQTVGATHDNDSDLVATAATSAMTGNAASKTVQQVSTTLSDLSGGTLPKSISLSITPTSGTLTVDDVIIHRIWMTY